MLATRTQEWKRQLVAEGKAEGKAEMLLRQLHRRFASLPSDTEARVRAAGSEQLDEWMDRFIDARDLTDLFDSDQRH